MEDKIDKIEIEELVKEVLALKSVERAEFIEQLKELMCLHCGQLVPPYCGCGVIE